MSDQISAWFKELIKDQVTVQYQAHGGYLDGTMMSGDVQANTVKFPIIGRTEVYQLTGAIEMVPTGSPGLSTVQLTMSDFEAAEWWRIQDAYKAGPSEQAALATILTKAIRRKRDTIKLDALAAFAEAGGDVTTIGDGTGRIDLLHFEQARAEIAGAAGDDDMIFAGIPAMWASQLAFYEEFGNARWVGDDNAPFSKTQRSKMRTVRDITYIELPDEYFTGLRKALRFTPMSGPSRRSVRKRRGTRKAPTCRSTRIVRARPGSPRPRSRALLSASRAKA
jgi:hypothetical protein